MVLIYNLKIFHDKIFIPKASATVKISLSPLPHMFITIISSEDSFPAIFFVYAKAWLGSKAGIIPSNWLQN